MLKRNGIYYTNFNHPVTGKRIRISLKTSDPEAAMILEHDEKDKILKRRQGKCTQTWEQAVAAYMAARRDNKDLDKTRQQADWLGKFLNGMVLSEITDELVVAITKASRAAPAASNAAQGHYRKDSTTNHYLTTLIKILNNSKDDKQLAALPTIKKIKIPKAKRGWSGKFLTYAEGDKLIEVLREMPRSQHLLDTVQFALATGLRHGNIVGLQWRWCYLDGDQPHITLPPEVMKAGLMHRVALSSRMVALLRRQKGNHPTYVFTYHGEPITSLNSTAFDDARDAAGVPWLSFHMLRHTWASWHVLGGTRLPELQQLGGWADIQMVMRYSHIGDQAADRFVDNCMRRPHLEAEVERQPLRLVAAG